LNTNNSYRPSVQHPRKHLRPWDKSRIVFCPDRSGLYYINP